MIKPKRVAPWTIEVSLKVVVVHRPFILSFFYSGTKLYGTTSESLFVGNSPSEEVDRPCAYQAMPGF